MTESPAIDVALRRIAGDLSILAARALLAGTTYADPGLARAGAYLEREADELRRVADRLERSATIAGGADSAKVEPGPSSPEAGPSAVHGWTLDELRDHSPGNPVDAWHESHSDGLT